MGREPQESQKPKQPYPLFLNLEGARVVVVGAGRVALRKIESLLAYGARVEVVAPEALDEIRTLAEAGALSWERRAYREGDLACATLAVVATGERAVDEAAYAEAQAAGTLINVVDVPDLCTCIVPSVMRRGRLQIAVSTGGAAPAVARDVRLRLEEAFPAWWEDYLDLLAEVRALVKQRVAGPASARTPLHEAVAAAGLEARLAAGERPTAEEVFASDVAPLLGASSQENRLCQVDSVGTPFKSSAQQGQADALKGVPTESTDSGASIRVAGGEIEDLLPRGGDRR